jgi:hypothetical protein
MEVMRGWLADVVLRFSALWDVSHGDQRWSALGHLQLGVLRTARGASRMVPGGYKRAVMIEMSNATGQGLRTPRQLLLGLRLAQHKGPSVRIGLRQRQLAHRIKNIAAKSQSSASKSQSDEGRHARGQAGYDFETFEQYNYFLDSRLEHLSEALRPLLTSCL